MQKEYLKYLTSESRRFSKKNDIFDIILYGSAVKGKEIARDIDILIIFDNNKSLKERTDTSQQFKESISTELKLDIKTLNIGELFENNFLARSAIFIEGYSLIYGEPFPKRLGFRGYSIFTYNLKNLDHNKKTRFTYSLIGRKKEKGILKKIGAITLGKGAFKIHIESSKIVEDFLKIWGVEYHSEDIVVSLT